MTDRPARAGRSGDPPAPAAALPAGMAFAASAYTLWGLFPIYFKAVAAVPALQVLAHRIVWTVAVMALVIALRRGGLVVAGASLRNRRLLATLALSATTIAVNWGVFVWAVAAGRVLECSLGYFINPLVSVAFGVVLLGERLRPRQWLAIAIAAGAVGVLIAVAGAPPWVGLTLAVSFALYGLLRKLAPVDPFTGLFVEALLLSPLALALLLHTELGGGGAFGDRSLHMVLLLVAAGPITALPLILFVAGARRIPLVTTGLLQYIAPTGHFLLAVFAYDEPFSGVNAGVFVAIWMALLVYTWDAVAIARATRSGRGNRA